MADMTMMPLDAPQPRYNVPDLSGIPDTEEDKPLPGEILVTIFHQASHLAPDLTIVVCVHASINTSLGLFKLRLLPSGVWRWRLIRNVPDRRSDQLERAIQGRSSCFSVCHGTLHYHKALPPFLI